jgi:1-acyl-sn-glycerol-3-phosphate acyltransferase
MTATAPVYLPDLARHERIHTRMRRVADGRAGMVVLYCWAVAEALVWPLIPDSALMGMAFAAPRRLARQWAATLAGTLTGGALGLVASRAGASWPLPLVTGRMRAAADGWLDAGAVGLWHQPLSGVPYKTFVQAAGQHDVDTAAWLVHTAGARGLRMLAFGAVAAAAGWALQRWVPEVHRARTHVTTVAVCTVGLFGGLAAVVAHWS